MNQQSDVYEGDNFVFECAADITEASVFAAFLSDENSNVTVGCSRPSITEAWKFHTYSKSSRLPIKDLDEESLKQYCESLQSTQNSNLSIRFRVTPPTPQETVTIRCGAGSTGSISLSISIIKSKGK